MLSHSIALYKNLQKRYSRRINLDLERIQKVLTTLAFPHLELKQVINILGSDGKMSTSASLQYFLEAYKKNVTTFSSIRGLTVYYWLINCYGNIR